MGGYQAAQCVQPLRVKVKDSLQLVFCHHQAVVQTARYDEDMLSEAKSSKGGPPEQKTIKRGNFSHVVRPPPHPPSMGTPMSQKKF